MLNSLVKVARQSQKCARLIAPLNSMKFSTHDPLTIESLNSGLKSTDPELYSIIEDEKVRQTESLVLIPSENFASASVSEALGSVMQNKYSEGYPNARYYGGNENIDKAELLCQKRALEAFNLDPAEWGVNVQSLSGSPANLQVYTALIEPHDRIMGLDLPHGGHLTHGFYTKKKKISATSIFYESMPYRLNEQTGTIDFEKLDEQAESFLPKIIIAGASAYSREYDYGRFREICDKHDSYLVVDMAHVSGLIAAGVHSSPFEHADVVTSTTHKSLRGPRAGLIFYRRGERKIGKKTVKYDLEDKINFSVFPGFQGGPHNHTITALATALKQASSPAFVDYQKQVVANSKAYASALIDRGYELVSGGTDNHLVLVDLRSKGVDGARVERVMELSRMAVNKNTVPGDKSALVPSGIRMGSPAMTTRGFVEKDFEVVADFFDEAVQITSKIKGDLESRKLKDFLASLPDENANDDILALRKKVVAFASSFPTVGY